MGFNDTREFPMEKLGDSISATLKSAQKTSVGAALLSAGVASVFTLVNYLTITYFENSACLDEKNISTSCFNISTSADFPYLCSMEGVLWGAVASLLLISALAVPFNLVFSLKWVQTSPQMLVLWMLFIWLWVLDNLIATLIIIIHFKDDTMISMVALPCTTVMVLGTWTMVSAFHNYVEVGKQVEEIRMKNNEIMSNKCMELQKYEKYEDCHFYQVPLSNDVNTYV